MREAPDGAAGAEALTQDEAVEGQRPSRLTPSAQVVKAHIQVTNRRWPHFVYQHFTLRLLRAFQSSHCSNGISRYYQLTKLELN